MGLSFENNKNIQESAGYKLLQANKEIERLKKEQTEDKGRIKDLQDIVADFIEGSVK